MVDNFEENLVRNVKEKREKKPEILEEHDIEFTIDNSSLYAILVIDLKPHKTVLVEASILSSMDIQVTLLTKLQGGLLQILANSLGTEPLCLNQFSVDTKPGRLFLSPSLPGDIHHYYVTEKQGILIKAASFLACKPTVQIDPRFPGMQDFYNDDSDFLLRLVGQGDLWFSCYGGGLELTITEDISLNPDYIVAFEDTLQYEVNVNEGLSTEKIKLDFWGGRGRLCRLRGEGKVWMQARQENMFLNFIQPFLPNLRGFHVK